MDGASPQAAEAATNSPVPSENIRRRPQRSPEPGAGDQQGAEGEAVAGDDPLEAAVGGVEVALHRRAGRR